MARTFAALLLVMAMTGNLFAAASCAEICAAAQHAGHTGHRAQTAAAHAGHAMEMTSHSHPGTQAPPSVEPPSCVTHGQPAAVMAANPATSHAAGAPVAHPDAGTTAPGTVSQEIAASPPPSAHLSSILTLRV